LGQGLASSLKEGEALLEVVAGVRAESLEGEEVRVLLEEEVEKALLKGGQ